MKNIAVLPNPKPIGVLVTLSAEDHKQVSLAAKVTKESVADWISGLVNTALIP
jgi:hypothetical protein